jgi:transposase
VRIIVLHAAAGAEACCLILLAPHLKGVHVDQVQDDAAGVQITARTVTIEAECPGCGVSSGRVHARYRRRLHDLSCAGRPVMIELQVRRFICGNSVCGLRTFVEQVPDLTQRYQHRTPPLRTLLEKVALALAGRAGSRMTVVLGVSVSRSTLIRLIRALPDPEIGQVTALGVDDFAKRRGHSYATILIDMDTHKPIDVLDGRSADPLAAWLKEHPGVQVICRDRAGAYAEGARIGAPDALQVADRFHLWQNLCQAVERCVARHRGCLADPGPLVPVAQPELIGPEPVTPTGRFADRAREHHALVHGLLEQGHGLREIARHLGWGRHTVQRFARAVTWQEMVKGPQKERPSALDAFKPYLRRRWEAGSTNIASLFREITAIGYQGSYGIVRNYLGPLRTTPQSATPAPPSVRKITGWLTRHPDKLKQEDQQSLELILTRCPELHAAARHVRSFAGMLTTLTGQHLPAWILAASSDDLPGISSFARGLENDLAAVTAGLTTRWNSGPVEGNVNRIKMIKRQMFGRADLDLLRKRILHAA